MLFMIPCQGEGLAGCPMTYSLFELAKEKAGDMLVSEEKAPLVCSLVHGNWPLVKKIIKNIYIQGDSKGEEGQKRDSDKTAEEETS